MIELKLPIPETFYKEEERDGYFISTEMKKIWAVELDLIYEFDRVCKKHNLTYFADGGTLLGAIRHKGFIPWDDDVDIVMMRDQYEKLCDIANSEFEEPYFFQTEYTDPLSLRGHAQLRNSNTTAILKSETTLKCTFNQGIFIDIFPMDAVPENINEFRRKIKATGTNLKTAKRIARLTDNYKRPKEINLKNSMIIAAQMAARFLPDSRKMCRDYYQKYEDACKTDNDLNTRMVAKYYTIPFCSNQVWNRDDFSSCVAAPFEMLEIPVPIGYESILKIVFGDDWRTPKKLPTYHSGVIFDTEKSYLEYIK